MDWGWRERVLGEGGMGQKDRDRKMSALPIFLSLSFCLEPKCFLAMVINTIPVCL